MKISVIVPVYNVEKYIHECIDSIINQTLKDLEIILVDDGSPDNCKEILDDYAIKDPRIKVIHKKNAGVSAARNDGLKICTGEYVYIMDSDDYLELDALESMYNNAKITRADVIITDHYTFTNNDNQKESHFFSKEFVTNDKNAIIELQKMTLYRLYSPFPTKEYTGLGIGAPWNKLIKRNVIFDNSLEFDSYVRGIYDDGLFSLNVLEYANSVSYIRKMTYHYRILSTSLIHKYKKDQLEIDRRVFERISVFCKNHSKEEVLRDPYYARIILFWVKSFRTYFFNSSNPTSKSENYKIFVNTLKSNPYITAIKEVDLSMLSKALRTNVRLCRMHLYCIVWLRYKLSRKK